MNADPTPIPDLDLRPGAAEDASALAELFIGARRAAEPAMPASVHAPAEIHHWFAGLGLGQPDKKRETWVAEQSGVVVGYVVLDPEWLDSLYVRHDLTGQGIGSVLLDLAKSLRPEGFGLWVFESNEPARRFYTARGLLALERTDGGENEEQAPDIAMVWPGTDPVAHLRRKIDAVDTDLGKVLARRAALTAVIQGFKPVAGHQGRDLAREVDIANRLAEHAPGLGPERIERILHVVISESLDAAAGRDDNLELSEGAARIGRSGHVG